LTYVVWSVHEYGAFRGDASRIKEGICVSSKVKRPLIACISELVHSESSDEASPGAKKKYFTIQKRQRDIRERLTRTSSVSNLHGPVPELKYSFPFLECAVYVAVRSDSVSDGM
jgi:hypothetical protein